MIHGQDRHHHRRIDDRPLHADQHLYHDLELPEDGGPLGGAIDQWGCIHLPWFLFHYRLLRPPPPGSLQGTVFSSWREAVDSFRALEVEYQGQPALIASVDGEVFLNMKVIRFTQGNPQAILRQFAAGQAILVTESFSLRHHVTAGDRMKLNTPQGEKEFLISGVFYDYSSDWGMILLEKKLFQSLWNDETLHSAGIYLKEGVSQEAFKEIIRERYSKTYRLFVSPSGIAKRGSEDL